MHLVVIGNGISGITAARFVRKLSHFDITVISAETEFFYARTALMYLYMGHLRFQDTQPYATDFWLKNRINLRKERVESVDTAAACVILSNGERLAYDQLILATGSSPNKFGWKGQDLEGVSGLYDLQDLAKIEARSKGLRRAVIVGGGLIGVELAEMLHSRHISVTFLVREASFWNSVLPPEESEMVNRQIRKNGIDLRLKTELHEIVDDGNGKACAVITTSGERIDCGLVGLTAGVHPNVGFLKNSEIELGRGVLVDEYLRTSVSNVFAIGDCAELRQPSSGRRSIEAVWYTGEMMGETVARTICGTPTPYQPRLWFNSAKFFDMEFQVYGTVSPSPPQHHTQLFWQHPTGEKSIRIVYDRHDGKVLGFLLMGIRYRHEVCEKWILSQTHIEKVLETLSLANFDPEFFKTYEGEIVEVYNRQTGANLQLRHRRSLNAVLKFLQSK